MGWRERLGRPGATKASAAAAAGVCALAAALLIAACGTSTKATTASSTTTPTSSKAATPSTATPTTATPTTTTATTASPSTTSAGPAPGTRSASGWKALKASSLDTAAEDPACLSDTTCVASNANTILRTTDAGATWSTVFSTGSSATLRLNSLTCTGSECIAIAYPKGNPPPTVEVSTDAGRTWRTVTLPLPAGTSQPYIDGVSCGTPTFCVAVGDVGDGAADVEWWTDNAGATWSDKEFALSLGGFGGVACTSAQFCVAAASQTVLVSTTGPGGFAPATGAPKWTLTTNQAVACVPGTTTCIVLADSDNCGQGDACTPVIAVSLGGETWTSASLPNGLGDLSSISCATTGYCVAGGYQQGLFDTSGTQGPPRATFLLHSHGTLAAWSRISLPKGTLDGLAGLSCATTSFCVGGGVFNHYVNDQTPYNSFVLIGPAK